MRQADKVDEVSVEIFARPHSKLTASARPGRRLEGRQDFGRWQARQQDRVYPYRPDGRHGRMRACRPLTHHELTLCSSDQLIASEETFGPVAGLFRFSSEEEVVVRLAHPTG